MIIHAQPTKRFGSATVIGMSVTPKDFSIRPMTSADAKLRERAATHNLARENRSIDQRYRQYLEFIPQRGDYGIVLSHGADIAGCAWVSFIDGLGGIPKENPEMVTYVDPAYSGKGLGTLMIKRIAAYGQDIGWPGIAVFLDESNPARRLFARLGFESQEVPGAMLLPLAPPVRRIAIYCGSASGARGDYVDGAEKLAAAIAQRGIGIVYGGGNIGLMGVIGTTARENGGQVIGVMPQALVDKEMAHSSLTTLEVVDSMGVRKERMEELADAFVALPGGPGTLEEFFQVFTHVQLGFKNGPLALYNISGFWTPLIKALERMCDEGFVQKKFLDALIVAESPEELFDGIDNWRYPGSKFDD